MMSDQSRGQTDRAALTEDQQTALAAMQDFITRGEIKCFLLEGYAGTGKTFLIRRLAKWLDSMKMSFILAAPTGRAAKVLSEKTGYVAGTIHRAIYNMDKLVEIPNAKVEDRFKFYYALKLVAEDDRPRVVIVDESSMVSDREGDDKFFRFGSGKLLADLMEFAGELQPDSKCQIVFVGDPAQLPPVGMSFSPALDPKYLIENFEAASERAILRQVVRQESGSAILTAATQIREDIEQNRLNRLDIMPDGKEMVEIGLEGVLELWSRECPPGREPSVSPPLVCVTWKNETALAYNASVRAKLYGKGDGLHPVQPRDYLMVVVNNRKTGLWNGELALVKSVDGDLESHQVALRTHEGAKQVMLAFRKVTLVVPSMKGGGTEIACMLLENILYGKERDISEDEMIAQWVLFKNRHKGLTPGTEQFRLALNDDPYFNALRVKFGYAVTCNKAQGGEWPSAVVIFERGRPSMECLRWTYTAVTRAQKTLYGVGFPHFGMIDWPASENCGDEGGGPGSDDAEINGANGGEASWDLSEAEMRSFREAGFPLEMDWMASSHFAAIAEWQGAGIKIERIELALGNYFIRYHLAKGGHKATLQVYFNGRRKLTPRPAVPVGFPSSDEFAKECDWHFMQASQSANSGVDEANQGAKELRELLELHVGTAVERLGGVVEGVHHLPYRERYRCRSPGKGLAVIDFCYNAKMQFRKRPEVLPETSDRAFALEIIQELAR